jgi:osmotically-inducible protein OsmY
MKKFILLLLLGVAAGSLVWGYRHHREQAQRAQAATVAAASNQPEATGSPINIATTARVLGGQLEDAAIVALIKGKYVLDGEISSLAIAVDCNNGRVLLTGSTASSALINRATSIARQTKGVTGVNARLIVRN